MNISSLPLLASCLSGTAVFVLIMGVVRFSRGRSKTLATRLHALEEQRRQLVQAPNLAEAQHQQGAIAATINRVAGQTDFAQRLEAKLAAADVRLTAGEFIVIIALMMAVSIFIGVWLHQWSIGLILVAGSYVLPQIWLNKRREKRLQKFNDQLPDMITILANAMRSGGNLAQAIQIAAQETLAPMSVEMNRVVFELKMQVTMQEALATMAANVPSSDLRLLINALVVQQESGGNIVALLEEISATIRRRVTLQAEIKSLTAQQRLSGNVVSLMPVGVVVLLMLFNPNYILRVFQTTLWCGWVMFGMAALMT
ncbi:MAG TPA: type II secretion system F family protein, partial [Ktedonobacterales bacterium]|nr:type II secretion system F family protein [Ktedonobacterales bacterium]